MGRTNWHISLARSGYVFLEKYAPSKSTAEVLNDFGYPLRLGNGGAVHALMPKDIAPLNTYSGLYGRGTFPLHTDLAHWQLPPRYFLLRCVRGTERVSTRVLDGDLIVQEIGQINLRKALVRPRRALGGRMPLLRLYEPQAEGGGLLRWDETFIQPASPKGFNFWREMKNVLINAKPIDIYLAEPGDTLLVDNWRSLHGRSPVPEDMSQRLIERAYMGALL